MISVRDLANPYILDLVPYEPGKPIEDVAREMGLSPAQIIKLASNENPLGPSPAALEAAKKALDRCHFYPDGGGFHLRNGIAETFGLARENVILGNGSNEIILLLFQAFCRPGVHEIVIPQNSFAVYELAAQLFGVRCVKVPDGEGFRPDLDGVLKAISPETRLVFLASPNNPTGTRVSNEDLAAFVEELPDQVVCGLDEAYYEFLDDPPDTVRYVRESRKVCLMRTFSKIQGLAGLRIGYGLAFPELADILQRSRQPFNANLPAQEAALAGLRDLDHQRRTKAITGDGRAKLEMAFKDMEIPFISSAANFVLAKVGDGEQVFRRLMARGIIVRSMKSYRLPEWIRVSIGTYEQLDRFLRELPYAVRGETPPFPIPEPDAAEARENQDAERKPEASLEAAAAPPGQWDRQPDFFASDRPPAPALAPAEAKEKLPDREPVVLREPEEGRGQADPGAVGAAVREETHRLAARGAHSLEIEDREGGRFRTMAPAGRGWFEGGLVGFFRMAFRAWGGRG
jgi:histidinol-phosphate aminotransferase